jgi:hypothetical protein
MKQTESEYRQVIKKCQDIFEKKNHDYGSSWRINYCVMALIQSKLPDDSPLELPTDTLTELYSDEIGKVIQLLFDKNHDYGEAWREMRISSMTDIILMKLLRIKQIEDNEGITLISEGVKSGYQDIINYAAFCLIKLNSTD